MGRKVLYIISDPYVVIRNHKTAWIKIDINFCVQKTFGKREMALKLKHHKSNFRLHKIKTIPKLGNQSK